MSVTYQQLTLDLISRSSEIEAWLAQFSENRRPTATDLLLKLRFIREDQYVDWLKTKIAAIGPGPCAIYAVRKFSEEITSYWDEAGKPLHRPAQSQGSEDFVQAIVANMMKSGDQRFLDHPELSMLKNQRVRHIALIDDSLGSGKRVSDFIDLFLGKSKTLMSWWSYGLFQFHVVALVRSEAAEKHILKYLPGSDHPCRKTRKSAKLHFVGEYHYDENALKSRWGSNATQIIDLCDSIRSIPYMAQRGFGGVMANVIFHHSVPDNSPGMLWYEAEGWNPLFPGRTFPLWMSKLLATSSTPLPRLSGLKQWLFGLLRGSGSNRISSEASAVDGNILAILNAASRGLRAVRPIARAIGLDSKVVIGLMQQARSAGLLSRTNRLTKAGIDFLRKHKRSSQRLSFDRSLYVPSKWCVGRGTVQPLGPRGATSLVQAESKASSLVVDGDAGQVSLERTDARSASPPLSVAISKPSESRMSADAHGPLGEREK
jgi:hypothetical protein